MIDKQKIGQRISFLRKKEGLSQTALAERLNISAQAVSKWECGQAIPDLEVLLELSWLFDISVDSLLNHEESFDISKKRKLPSSIEEMNLDKENRNFILSLAPYFNEVELIELTNKLMSHKLDVKMQLFAKTVENKNNIEIPYQTLPEKTLQQLASYMAECLGFAAGRIERSISRISNMLRCPVCQSKIEIKHTDENPYFVCKNGHTAVINEGVIDFGTRESNKDLWSLTFRNFKQYYDWKNNHSNSNYQRENRCVHDVFWQQLSKTKPRIILDVATGMAFGMETILDRIDWQCLVIMTDLSHRILKWNRVYYTQFKRNPFVDMVYIACDCSGLPFNSNSVDAVTSFEGFESMQEKRTMGFKEANRILKKGGYTIYDMNVIEDVNSENSKKWLHYITSSRAIREEDYCLEYPDLQKWEQECRDHNFSNTESVKIHGELIAPEKTEIPLNDETFEWMSKYVMISTKE